MDPMDVYDRLSEVGRDGQSTSSNVLAAQPSKPATRGKRLP